MPKSATPAPSPTKKWHSTSYPAIDPRRPELGSGGRTVVITGGGTGIGAAVARGFATAGATKIALLGRTQATLTATAKSLEADFPRASVLTLITDVSNETSVNAAFNTIAQKFGKIDIFVSNAGSINEPGPIATADVEDWMKSFDTNVKGNLLVLQAFLRNAAESSYLLHTSTGIAHMPPMPNGVSSYAASKLASIKLLEYAAAENPGVHLVHIQPGIIATTLASKGGGLDLDDADLPGNFYVWLTSAEAAFLKNKFVWANWDVEELISMKEKVPGSELFDVRLKGISFDQWTINDFLEHSR